MRILVPLQQILDPSGLTVNRKAGKVFVNKENDIIDPAAKRALEAALQIAETTRQDSATGAEVIVAAIGPARAADSLREARAMGAARGLLISTAQAVNDEAVAARLLTALVNHLGGVDLLIAGESAIDSGLRIGPRLAEALNFAYLGAAVACSVEAGSARIIRSDEPDRQRYHTYAADLPAVVTVTRAGPAPRYPHGGDIILIYRDPNAIETLTPVDLSLSESDLQPVAVERGQSFPPEREFGKVQSLEEVAALLRARH